MNSSPYRVLFLCTGNSARSIIAEALLNHHGAGRFQAFSAGSAPKGKVNPHAIALLQRLNIPVGGLRSKSWDEFASPSAPMDCIITVCSNAAGEACPAWPGHPFTAHWDIPDPAAVEGPIEAKEAAFRSTLQLLEHRIRLLVNLPESSLNRLREMFGEVSAAQ